MKAKTLLVKLWAFFGCFLTFGILLFLFVHIFSRGFGAISWEFLTSAPKGMVLGTEGGILPAIVGSACYTAIACLIGALLGIATAIYQVYYCPRKGLSDGIALVMKCMAGVPSIVMGLFGYSLLVLRLGWGKCLLAGGVTQGIMILPFIQVRAEKTLREMDPALVKASYGLGASRFYTLRRIVLPQCFPQLLSALILGACYAMGAAAPLIFTGAVIIAKVPKSLMKPAMALPYHLYMLLTQGTSGENAYGTAFVMMFLVLVSNGLATYFAWRRKR